MPRLSLRTLFITTLGLLCGIALLTNTPDIDSFQAAEFAFTAVFVALILNLGVRPIPWPWLSGVVPALLAYLALGEFASVLWGVAAGVALGVLFWRFRQGRGHDMGWDDLSLGGVLVVAVAPVTLTVWAGDTAYRRLGGALPLEGLSAPDLFPLAVLLMVALVSALACALVARRVYFRASLAGESLTWAYRPAVLIVIAFPVAILGAIGYQAASWVALGMAAAGLALLMGAARCFYRLQDRQRQQAQELESLQAVNRVVRGGLDIDALLDVVYQQAAGLFHAQDFAVALQDAARMMLSFPLVVQDGHVSRQAEAPVDRGLLEYVIRTQQPLLLAHDSAGRAAALGIEIPDGRFQSWMAVPLISPDRVLGCMAIATTAAGSHFNSGDLRVLMSMADQIALALHNVSLSGQAQDRSRQLATLNNVAALLGATLNTKRIYDLVSTSALAVAEADAVALYIFDPIRSAARLVRSHGFAAGYTADPIEPLLFDLPDLDQRRQPVVVTDVNTDQRTIDRRAVAAHEGKRAWIELLLHKGDELLGALVCFYRDPHPFGREEIELLRNFSVQAALAMSNARLYTSTDAALSRRVEQLSAAADIARELASTLDQRSLFSLIIDRALETTGSDAGLLVLRRGEGIELAAASGLVIDPVQIDDLLDGALARTWQSGDSTVVHSDDGEEQLLLREGIQSQLNVAIRDDESVIGAIVLGSERADAYGPDDLTFAAQLGTQAQIAIANAALFRHIEIARDRLQVILDSMHEGVILIEGSGWITLANPGVETLLGLPASRLMEEPVAQLIRDRGLRLAERLGTTDAGLLDLVDQLELGLVDAHLRRWDRATFTVSGRQTYVIERNHALVRDELGRATGLVMVFTDVTEQHALAQARADLTNMIVHDLRGPLTAVNTGFKLLSELAASTDVPVDSLRETVETSGRGVQRLMSLVDSLLDVAKMESGLLTLDCEPIALRAMINRIVGEVYPLAAEQAVDLQVDIVRGFPMVSVDADKIERVLFNLLDNALKYAPADSAVIIRASLDEAHAGENGMAQVAVQDAGPGIPDDDKERLFDRYVQLSNQAQTRRRGTGLGLTFCKLAVEAHGGSIWVEDGSQGGAVFAFTVPLAPTLPDDIRG